MTMANYEGLCKRAMVKDCANGRWAINMAIDRGL